MTVLPAILIQEISAQKKINNLRSRGMIKISLLWMVFLLISGCRSIETSTDPAVNGVGTFRIILQESGEEVINDSHLESYEVNEHQHVLNLNSSGIERIKYFVDWDTKQNPPTPIPKLYLRPFIAKFGSKDLYAGKFFSLVCSQSYDGVVILDVFMVLSSGKLTIELGYPTDKFYKGSDPRLNDELFRYLTDAGKFKKTGN